MHCSALQYTTLPCTVLHVSNPSAETLFFSISFAFSLICSFIWLLPFEILLLPICVFPTFHFSLFLFLSFHFFLIFFSFLFFFLLSFLSLFPVLFLLGLIVFSPPSTRLSVACLFSSLPPKGFTLQFSFSFFCSFSLLLFSCCPILTCHALYYVCVMTFFLFFFPCFSFFVVPYLLFSSSFY